MTPVTRLALIKSICQRRGIVADASAVLSATRYDLADERKAITTTLGDDTIPSEKLETAFLQDLIFEGGQ